MPAGVLVLWVCAKRPKQDAQACTCRNNCSRSSLALPEVIGGIHVFVTPMSCHSKPSVCWCEGLKISNISNPFVQTCSASHFIRGRLSTRIISRWARKEGRKGVMSCYELSPKASLGDPDHTGQTHHWPDQQLKPTGRVSFKPLGAMMHSSKIGPEIDGPLEQTNQK